MVDKTNPSFLRHIEAYRDIRPKYEQFCKTLKEICGMMIKEYISEEDLIIQSRVKSISSFADKISRPNTNYSDPLNEVVDICGVRIILSNLDQVKTTCQLLRENFFVDVENEEDIDIPNPREFGTSSKQFIVQLLPENDYRKRYKSFNLTINEELLNFKAEVQIRTILQHGWAVNQYDEVFEKKFKIPEQYQRDLNQSAALLEIADASLTQIHGELSDFESNFPAYMTKEQILKEINRLEIIYGVNRDDVDLAYRISKMASVMEDWDKTIEILESVINMENWGSVPTVKSALIHKELGIALYKKHKKDYITYHKNNSASSEMPRESMKGFEKAFEHLEKSTEINPKDSDAFASLGGYWKDIENDKALENYKQALKIDPDDPYSLGNYIILNIQQSMEKSEGNVLKIIDTERESIKKGIEKRLKQINVKIEIPWAFFDVGLFNLYLGNTQEALLHYLKGIQFSQEIWMIETTLKTLDSIKEIQDQLPGLKNARTMLLLSLYARKLIDKAENEILQQYYNGLKDCGLEEHISLTDPIVIIAGGTTERIEKELNHYKEIFINSFKEYEGIIISGGTPAGIAGLVGDIQEAYPYNIKSIGYRPEKDQDDVPVDGRYALVRRSKRTEFSIFDTFQIWFDIMRSGIQPNQVKLIGINGGRISALEFRLAVALGAQVAILKDSGRSATELINDKDWRQQLKPDQKPIRLFKVINKTEEDIHKFLTKQFIIDPDIDNLRMFFIILRTGNYAIYSKEFITSELSKGLLASLLEALDLFADEIKIGNIASVISENGCITGGFLSNNIFKIVFILSKKPDKSLENKIAELIQKLNQDLLEELNSRYSNGRVFKDHAKMSAIFTDVFGQEIQKFFKNM